MIFISKSFRTIVFIFIVIFLSNLFNFRFTYCIHLYTLSTQLVITACHMCRFLKASKSSNVQLYQLFQLHPIRADGFPFPSIYGPPYLTFLSHLVLQPSDVLALLLVGTCFSFVYFTTTARDGVNTVLDIVEFCWWLDPEEISPKS